MNNQLNDSVSYVLEADEAGNFTLSIKGTGPMPDYLYHTDQPWHAFADRIVSLVIDDGITDIGDECFSEFTALERVEFPPSVGYIGSYSFRDCPNLKEVFFSEGFEHVGSKAFQNDGALSKITFPSTLRTIDIKSFQYCDSVSEVYYGGSRWQWEHYIVVDKSFSANDSVLNADIQYGIHPDISADFDDIPSDFPYLSEIGQLYERSLMDGNGRTFGPNDPMTVRMLFDALYLHSGADCLYRDSMHWGSSCLGLASAAEEKVTLSLLCQALYRFSLHNGAVRPDGKASPWLDWADRQGLLKKLISVEGDPAWEAALTRGQCACVLAPYLDTDDAVADRYEEMTASLRQLIASGGDGNFHIIAINLNKRGMFSKAGDASLLILPKGSLMMIDCGFTAVSKKLVSFLRDAGVTSLDYLVFSHCHLDHTGGAPDVCRYIYEECGGTIGHFWFTGANLDKTNIAAVTEYLADRGVVREDIRVDESGPVEKPVYRSVDGVKITFFGPNVHDLEVADANYEAETANNTSLVMRFDFGSSVYLTAGDLYLD